MKSPAPRATSATENEVIEIRHDALERAELFYCLKRYELVSVCPDCGEHSTIVRMSNSALYICGHCQASMLAPI